MSFILKEHISINGIAACVPSYSESNLDYEWISEKERKKLIKTTGIAHRRIASTDTTASDMSFHAASKLLSDLDAKASEIDVLINVTQTPDYLIPGTALLLQDRLKMKKDSIAFDINLGCSGYVYGLYVLSSLIDGKSNKKGLLLAGDKSSHPVNYKDKSTYPLFGDAGSATLIEYNENAEPMFFKLNSDGSGHEAIIVRSGGLKSPASADTTTIKFISERIERASNELELNGMDVFSFATTKVPVQIKALIDQFEIEKDSIDYFIFHQANKLMNELIRKKLKLSPEKVPYSLEKFGNTSSASIPLTIVTNKANLKPKDKVLISGFGVGLSWASSVVNFNNTKISELVEI